MSILIVIVICMMIAVVGCYDAREDYRVPRSTDGPWYHRQMKEPREKRAYIEQCRASQFRRFLSEEQLGHVNVFAFLDPSWYYSYRQFVMLELLKKRLEKSSFSNISFFVVTPPSYLMKDSTENSSEIKAWMEVSKNMMESEYFLDAEESSFNDSSKKDNGIILLRDSGKLGIWEEFRAAKDEVAIVDRCGRIAYQIIVPWSILYFPYVKAAILSTYREDPCGSCEINLPTSDSLDYEEYLLENINFGERQVDNGHNMNTEEQFTDSETPVSLNESRKMMNDKNASIIVPLDISTYDSRNVTTEMSIVQELRSENVSSDDSVSEKNAQTHVTDTISETATTEIYTENQDNIYRNNNNDFLENNDSKLATRNNGNEFDMKQQKLERKDESTKYATSREQKDEILALRIILYAPHLHEENETFQKYTHLVLKTGSPEYHDHFHSKTIDHKPVVIRKSDPAALNEKKLIEYVNTINESPGVYGEIADYWQTDELNNKNDNTEITDYDYATVEDVDDTIDNSSVLKPDNIDVIKSEVNAKENDESKEFMPRRLIEHYNRLLPWIYYIL